ncbi:MAG: helix-turn-helix transcriptional regulator [Lachnospiraceae bacterium]|nr:helix-turn-helix transcriptional regulator [Lachnospiraceae bacterium]
MVMKHTLKKINLGKNIRTIRLQRQMTRKEVIAKMRSHGSKMSRISLAYIEWGRGDIKAGDLRLLKQVFNVEYDKFFV